MYLWLFALLAGLLPTAFAQYEGDTAISGVNQCITPRACFRNNTESTVLYCITTQWYITYDKRLRNYIQNNIPDYSLVDYKADPDFDKCGWNSGESVSKTGVDRGTIFYKSSTNASLAFRPTALVPRIRGATNMLTKLYPSAEIALILVCFSIFLWYPLGRILWICGSALSQSLSKMCKSTASGVGTMFASIGACVKGCFSRPKRASRTQEVREKRSPGSDSASDSPSSDQSSDGWCEKV